MITASLPVSDLRPGDVLRVQTTDRCWYTYEVLEVVIKNGAPWVYRKANWLTTEITFRNPQNESVIEKGSISLGCSSRSRDTYVIDRPIAHATLNGERLF